MTLSRLSISEQLYKTERISTTLDNRFNAETKRISVFYEIGYQMGIQQCPDQRIRLMESRLCHQQRTI